jgi:hypothetical protein
MVSSPEIRAKVATSRAKQGLPPVIEDPATLERVAAVLRLVPVQPAVPPQRTRRRKTTAGQVART